MTRLTDNAKTVDIAMTHWTGSGYSPDWSQDFFAVGGLELAEDGISYIVPDVDYCVSCAQDWENGCWDGDEDADPAEIENRCVTVEIIEGRRTSSKEE